jgi:hypothetical protein
MKKTIAILVAVAAPLVANAQQQSLGSTMDVYVFPAEGQDSAQQSKDEAECYEWAVGNTGTDPFDLAKQEQADQQQAQSDQQAAKQAGQGSAARGAVRGAAAGAQQQAAAQAEQREEATEQQLVNFKNAFSVCLEAKEYMVKY